MLKRNLIANYLGQGWSALMGVVFIPLYIKYLGMEAYGLIGLFALLTTWLSLLDMGMTPTLGREMARFTGGGHNATSIRDLLRSFEIIAFCIVVLIAGGIALSADWLASSWLKAEKLPISEVAQAFTIMGLVTALRFLEDIYRSSIAGLQRQVLLNVVNSSMATIRALGAVAILAWWSPTIEAFFLWQGLASLAKLAIFALATYMTLPRAERRGRFSLTALLNVWRFAIGMMAGTLTGLLLSTTDKIILSKYLSLKDFGFYSLAGTVVGFLSIMLGPVNQAVFPRFAELMSLGEENTLRDTFHLSAQVVSVAVGSIAWVLFFQAENFLLLWTGDALLAAHTAPVLSLLSLYSLISSPIWMLYQAQLAYGWTRVGVFINILNMVFVLPAFILIVPKSGMVGAAAILCFMAAMGLVLHFIFTFRKILSTERLAWAWNSVLMPLGAGLVINWIFSFAPRTFDNKHVQLLFLAVLTTSTLCGSMLSTNLLRLRILDAIMNLKKTNKNG